MTIHPSDPFDETTTTYSFGSYEPIVTPENLEAEPEDVVPDLDPRDTDVWLTEWQVAEDGMDVALDQQITLSLVPMDQDWMVRLFAGRRAVSLQLDTYADATRDPSDLSQWSTVSGRVARIDQISVRYIPSEDPADRGSQVPETGAAMQHTVHNVKDRRAHHGSVVGFIVRIRGKAPAPRP